MTRLIVLVILAALSFVLALAGAMAVTGNLSKEALSKLLGREPKAEESAASATPAMPAAAEPKDDVDPIAQALKDRDEQLKQRAAKLAQDEERLKIAQQDLDKLRDEVQQLLEQAMQRVTATEQGHTEALQGLAKTLSQMKPKNAADSIAKFSAEDAANVLRLMKEKESGKILDSMETDQRALIMRALAQPKLETLADGETDAESALP